VTNLTHLESPNGTHPERIETLAAAQASPAHLSELEINSIELFVAVAHFFNFSKSIGEIYGLLFISPAPISVEEIRFKLRMSSGSASQGLSLLRRVHAVRIAYLAGDRRDYYVAETGLGKIAAGFLREKIAPHLSDQEERIIRLANLLTQTPLERRHLAERIEVLQSWRKQARAVLPMVLMGLEHGKDTSDMTTPQKNESNHA
jgi:DNA-binding transcriptional regulator GbsR (MarR family)